MKKENMRSSKLNKEQNKSITNLNEAPSNNNSNLNNEQKNTLNNLNNIPKEKNAFSENEINKLNGILFKKINFFYKTYIRYLRRVYNMTDLSNIFEIIKTDIDNFKNRADPFSLTKDNLNDKCYNDLDIKTMLIVNFFRELGGNNPLHTISSQIMMEKMLSNKEDNLNDENDYVPFSELSIENKVNFLYFFCNYCMTFSGRTQIFKDEINKNKDENFILNKRINPLFSDKLGNDYYIFPINKDCRVYIDKINVENPIEDNLENNIKNYEELEQFLEKETNNQLKKKINEHLLEFKNNDKEEKEKQKEFLRKEEMFEKAKILREMKQNEMNEKYQSNDILMNIYNGVITRNQLNKITKLNQYDRNKTEQKPKELTEEEKRRLKIEKENYEREKRMEKRNRIQEQMQKEEEYRLTHNVESMFVNKKRNKEKKTKKYNKNSWSDEEEEFEELENEMNLESDDEEYYHNVRKHKHNNNRNYSYRNYYDNSNDISEKNDNVSQDIINEGYLLYRYSSNQIEIEGFWYVNDEPSYKERLSYLFSNSNSIKHVIMPIENNNVNVTICSANLIEDFSIDFLFKECLNFLSGEYTGYFMYYSKTIEDRFQMNLSIEDSLVKLYGNGTNNLGAFNIDGYMNFFRTKEILLEKNKIEEPVIKLAEFKMKKVYNKFNPTENERVIKSYNHRRKKNDEDNY